MNIFVAGATGRVAQFLIRDLVAAGHQVLAGARRPEAVLALPGVTPVALDLHDSPEQLATLLAGVDAVYFTAGSRGRDLLQTDAFGAVSLMQAAEMAGVQRFILLSAILATQPDKWQAYGMDSLRDYNIAKFFADHWLMDHTQLAYTILQPGVLIEAETATGRVDLAPAGVGDNTIPNVARVLAALLDHPETIGQVLAMTDGDLPLDQALAQRQPL